MAEDFVKPRKIDLYRLPGYLDSSNSSEELGLQVAGLSWNPNHGLLVAIGKKPTIRRFQSIRKWLSAPEQRSTLAKLDNRIELWPNQPDPNSGQNDYRLYTILSTKIHVPNQQRY